MSSDPCPICYETSKTYLYLHCSHFVCNECFRKLHTLVCPMCRAPINGECQLDNIATSAPVTQTEFLNAEQNVRRRRVRRRRRARRRQEENIEEELLFNLEIEEPLERIVETHQLIREETRHSGRIRKREGRRNGYVKQNSHFSR